MTEAKYSAINHEEKIFGINERNKKYVAFLDILGFKNKLRGMSQEQASRFISNFSATAYSQWKENNSLSINGYIVSDSFIIYSNDISKQSLEDLIRVVTNICKNEFVENSIILRGAIAKGYFEKLEAKEISTLGKELIVGQAYVDAYLLEGTVKSIGIVLSSDVYEDMKRNSIDSDNLFKEIIGKQEHYILRYLTLDFFLNQKNLHSFIKFAIKSKWLPHYYNTLYFALKREKNENEVNQLFNNLLEIINKEFPDNNWRNIDMFIKNAFCSEVINEFQTRFLKYIRQKIFDVSL